MTVVMGPGAGPAARPRARDGAGLPPRGLDAAPINLSAGRAEPAAEVFAALAAPDVVAGGHSFGGRAASLAAAERDFAGLLLFGFPLSERAEARTAHFPRIRCPVLLLNGECDPLSPILVLRQRAALLPRRRLVRF